MPTEPQSQPLVSIIVPVYNAADHIARCIESIRRQTYRNLEIILLNDGSKDVSYAVCQSYAGIDRRIVVIDKNNSGVSATRNLGMQEAHGKYFQFVDADDFIQPYATELLVQKAEASHADMVIAHYNRIEPPVSLPKTMRDTVVERVLDPILDPQHRVQTFGFLMEGPLNKDAFEGCPYHPRQRRAGPPGCGHGLQGRNFCRAFRYGRSDRDLHQYAQPKPACRHADWPRKGCGNRQKRGRSGGGGHQCPARSLQAGEKV